MELENGLAIVPAKKNGRRIITDRSIRWDEERARQAYAEGLWVHETLADTLARAAADAPDRVLIIDGPVRLDARSLHAQATVLARVLAARYPSGGQRYFLYVAQLARGCRYLAGNNAGRHGRAPGPALVA